jgi:hypothetical protein
MTKVRTLILYARAYCLYLKARTEMIGASKGPGRLIAFFERKAVVAARCVESCDQ